MKVNERKGHKWKKQFKTKMKGKEKNLQTKK